MTDNPFIKFDRFEGVNSQTMLMCVSSPAVNPQKPLPVLFRGKA